MQIQIKCSCFGEKCQEWAIVELQGEVEVQPDFQHQIQSLPIGQLCRPSSQETYTFTVGYHELTGTKMSLKKPMLVLKKGKKSSDPVGGVDLEVIGVIRNRILFKTRPKALISKPQTSVKGRAKAADAMVPN
ncbi:Chromosome transmission fidelity protein [Parasponia andersonii]|uniref:Chromosome transmission fidelity protein n=1 Tax=Parasponia andersonii TaxID=3476 RepID=A0A2P5CUE1_PARAD|nr:Chromosome transmission fidelity protein [Parasponia andersonii]